MFTRKYIDKNGRAFAITLDYLGESINVFCKGQKIGFLSFTFETDSDLGRNNNHYHITHLALNEGFTKLGIGEACLQFHIEKFSLPLTAASQFDTQRDDGSHLTNDGVPFIMKMRQRGIVCPDPAFENIDD